MMSLPPPQPFAVQSCRGRVTPPPIASPGVPDPRPASTWGEYRGGGEGSGSGGGKTAQIPVLEEGDPADRDAKIPAERFPLNNDLWEPRYLEGIGGGGKDRRQSSHTFSVSVRETLFPGFGTDRNGTEILEGKGKTPTPGPWGTGEGGVGGGAEDDRSGSLELSRIWEEGRVWKGSEDADRHWPLSSWCPSPKSSLLPLGCLQGWVFRNPRPHYASRSIPHSQLCMGGESRLTNPPHTLVRPGQGLRE